MSACRGCGCPIDWIRTTAGRNMPVDPEPVFVVEGGGNDELERRILQQIIYAVTGKPSFGCVGTYTNRKRKKRGVECTAAEKLEIEANHAFFYEAAKKEMEVFLYAFYMKNGLFPSGDKVETKEWEELTPEQKEEVLKASMMAEGMERHTLRKALGDGSGHEGGGLNDG